MPIPKERLAEAARRLKAEADAQPGSVDEYIRKRLEAARAAALERSRTRTTPAVPRIPVDTGSAVDAAYAKEVADGYASQADAALFPWAKLDVRTHMPHSGFDYRPVMHGNETPERRYERLSRLSSMWSEEAESAKGAPSVTYVDGPSCIYTATDNYGNAYRVSGNGTFLSDPGRFGFVQIPYSDAQPGDIVQSVVYDDVTGRGFPAHGMVLDGIDDRGIRRYNYSNGDADESAIVVHGKFHPENDTDRYRNAFRFVGTPADSLRWRNEWEAGQMGDGGRLKKIAERINYTSNADFVKRLLDRNRKYIIDENGKKMTHRLGYVEEDGHAVVFPDVQSDGDSLRLYPYPESYERAVERGDTVHMSVPDAELFTMGYKGVYPGFDSYRCGGKIYGPGGKFFRTAIRNEAPMMYDIPEPYPVVTPPNDYPWYGPVFKGLEGRDVEYPSSTGMYESHPIPMSYPVDLGFDYPLAPVPSGDVAVDLFSDEAKARRRMKQRYAESAFNDSARSRAGAQGAWQIMPITLKDYLGRGRGKSGDLNDPEYNGRIRDWVMGIIPRDLQEFWSDDDTPMNKLAKLYAAYNWGAGSLRGYFRKRQKAGLSNDDPYEWVEGLNPETRRYVKYLAFDEDIPDSTYTNSAFEKAAARHGYEFKSGGRIHIKPSHRGRLTELKKRTGKSEAELYNDGNPAHKRMVVFARNARKWRHGDGGFLKNYYDEGGDKDPIELTDSITPSVVRAYEPLYVDNPYTTDDFFKRWYPNRTDQLVNNMASFREYATEWPFGQKRRARKNVDGYVKSMLKNMDENLHEYSLIGSIWDRAYPHNSAYDPNRKWMFPDALKDQEARGVLEDHIRRKNDVLRSYGVDVKADDVKLSDNDLRGEGWNAYGFSYTDDPYHIFYTSAWPANSTIVHERTHTLRPIPGEYEKYAKAYGNNPMEHAAYRIEQDQRDYNGWTGKTTDNLLTEAGRNEEDIKYYSNPHEIVARLNAIRFSLGLNPRHTVTAEDLKEIRSKASKKDREEFLDLYTDEALLRFFNEIADAGKQESLHGNHLGNISARGGRLFYTGGPYGVIPLGGDYLTYLQSMPEISGGAIEPAVVTAALPAKFNGSQEAARRYAEGYQKGAKPVSEAMNRAGQKIFNTVDTVVGLTPTPAGAITWLGHMGADTANGEYGKVGKDLAMAAAMGLGLNLGLKAIGKGYGYLRNYWDEIGNFGEDIFRAFTDGVPGRVSTNFTYAAPATRAAVEAVPAVSKAASAPYEIENLGGGYMLKSLMRGNPLEKQISKNGTVGVNNVRALANKGSKVEQAVIDKVLSSEQFAGKKSIDYNEFRKAVQDELITYERTPDTRHADYGLDRIGLSFGNKTDVRNAEDRMDMLRERIRTGRFRNGEKLTEADIADAKEELEKMESFWRQIPETESYTFSSPRIPTGSDKHYDANTLGHSRTYTTADEPDVLHVMESQSDWAQNKLASAVSQEGTTHDVAELESILGVMEETGASPAAIEEQRKLIEVAKRNGIVDEQTSYLHNNYTSRQIQENLRYAAEKGQKKMRYPTRETVAKIEGYPEREAYFDAHGNDVTNEKVYTIGEENEKELSNLREAYNKRTHELNQKYHGGKPMGFGIDWNTYFGSLDKEYAKMADRINQLASIKPELKPGITKKTVYDYEDILRKYTEFPKQFKKLFKNADVRTVTDPKGNTWYEVDVPENYLKQEWAYEEGGSLILPKMMIGKHSPDKLKQAIANIRARQKK